MFINPYYLPKNKSVPFSLATGGLYPAPEKGVSSFLASCTRFESKNYNSPQSESGKKIYCEN